MPGLHYTKSGALDMRYSSSRAAMSSSSSYGGGGSTTPMRSAYSSSPSPNSGLHYKKDGSLDMRFSSSKQAAAPNPPSSNGTPHYKKDGSLDMRFSSSKQQAAAPTASTSSIGTPHYKKDGSLDMRFSSSKQAAAPNPRSSNGTPHYKKDGSLDMRFSSSKQAAAGTSSSSNNGGLHYKKDGSLDMRYKSSWNAVSDPKAAKDNAAKKKKSPKKNKGGQTEEEIQRFDYLFDRLENCPEFFDEYARLQENPVDMGIPVVMAVEVGNDEDSYVISMGMTDDSDDVGKLGDKFEELVMADSGRLVKEYNFHELNVSNELLGKGGFGQVFLGSVPAVPSEESNVSVVRNIINSFSPTKDTSNHMRPVAVKKMFLSELKKSEKREFLHEIKVMSLIGVHPNVIGLVGYSLDTPAIIMEYASNKSLSYQLYHNENPVDEAKLACGSIKKKIIFGIANGLNQIHSRNIVHGDIKSPNILLDEDFTPKVCDFGLSKLKAKTVSTVGSTIFDADGKIGGTYAYMAPELADFNTLASSKTDVYAFGVLMNEIISELEPYQSEYQRFHGRGPTAPLMYAQQGNRPQISSNTSPGFEKLIRKCWSSDAASRPSLSEILNMFVVNDSLIVEDTFSDTDLISVSLMRSQNL